MSRMMPSGGLRWCTRSIQAPDRSVLFLFNQYGDLERCRLRPGNVHSAEDWRLVLEPVIARYRESPTHGEQEGSVWNGHFGCTCYHPLGGLFRQSVFGRLAGYEDVNNAERLACNPAMRAIVGREGLDRAAASSSQMGRLETEWLATDANLEALAYGAHCCHGGRRGAL
jgi:hypothetical protein